jgi:transaldolase/glucose-6-phosphate isomerase
MTMALPPALAAAVRAGRTAWRQDDGTHRVWSRDAELWSGSDEARWLGWLDVAQAERAALAELTVLADTARHEGVRHVAVLGMGGSSLCPYVFAATFGRIEGRPSLHVLDSTDPAQIRTFEAALDLGRTLFVVSSKSGSTLEPSILRDYFLARVREVAGVERAGRQFVAITDPGSQLERQARADGFRAILPGVPEIGGRFSALSNFGVAPAVLAGLDAGALLERADAMAAACRSDDPDGNPGAALGTLLGAAQAQGVDKLTIIASPGIAEIGSWLEQLIAESTGKHGKAVIPVAGEALAAPDRYGEDRLFAYLRLDGASDAGQDAAVAALERAGRPVVRIALASSLDLAAEFFRWEFATAVCGAVMKINPFDQPDVEASKLATRALTDEVEKSGALPPEEPFCREPDLACYADAANVLALASAAGERTVEGFLRAHLTRLGAGDYFAVLAYVEMNGAHAAPLEQLRHRVRDARRVATTLGFGPRFLHSTGQAHKGGPDSGVFLQITCEAAQDLPVPGRRYSFGTVKAAQARGDFAVLAQRGRRALRIHLGADVAAGLRALDAAVARALP